MPDRLQPIWKEKDGLFGSVTSKEVYIDTYTGVQYLIVSRMDAGVAVLPLLDAGGKPLVIPQTRQEPI
ncbi:MAG: DUF6440 family protein [Oscillospiraceae bacterium]|jgi:hypothetical protein|nr:DUF6440 family protein [Oscillospiraceae bacterium]